MPNPILERKPAVLTHVFLRVEHDTAKPELISDLLGITPTEAAESGQGPTSGKGEMLPSNVWVLDSVRKISSKDVRVHFRWLLTIIGPLSAEFENLRRQGFRIAIHCVWFGDGGYGGPELPADVLRGLACLDVDLFFHFGILPSDERRV